MTLKTWIVAASGILSPAALGPDPVFLAVEEVEVGAGAPAP